VEESVSGCGTGVCVQAGFPACFEVFVYVCMCVCVCVCVCECVSVYVKENESGMGYVSCC